MENNQPFKKIWQLISSEKSEIFSIYFYAILSGLVQLSVPIGVQAIIGFVLGASMVASIYVLIFVVVAGVVIVGIMQINQMKIIEKIQQKIFYKYAFEFAETIPRIDIKQTDQYYLPEKVNRFFDTVAWLEEMAKILKSIKFNASSNLHLEKTDQLLTGYLKARTSHFNILLFQFKTLVLFKVIITTTMLVVGTYLLLSQQLNIGEFIAAEIVILTVIGAVEKLIGNLDSVYDIATGIEKLTSFTELPIEKKGTLKVEEDKNGFELEIKNLSFEYHPGKKILNDLNINIESNSKVVISGDEGAGKTTLLKILSGNYSDFEGLFLINKIPLANYDLDDLRSYIGKFLNQQELFSGTVLENITMGNKKIHIKEIVHLANTL
ncbi:MAG: ATP-binding cassette domain-containing protein, partial [Bacteroidetes bacterium]|nr:ATP-binding cassette domain-containing protein [Bacteroidota bacterium]